MIEQLFNDYLAAFKNYNLDNVAKCYHLPCTLHTPDKLVFLKTVEECKNEFGKIFAQLKQANTAEITARKASFSTITESLLLACVDWDFIDAQGEVFADFCAVYNLAIIESELKIISVVSHDLSNTLTLEQPFVITS